GVSLVRHSWPWRWVKWVVVVLTVYGVAAFLKGIISDTSFPSLFHGESFWTWMPSWLQGAFVGALVVVPVGLVFRAAEMFTAAPGASREWDLRQVIAMAMIIVLGVSGMTGS